MTLGTILLVVLVLALLGVIPTWPHSRQWGYVPSGAIGLVLLRTSVPIALAAWGLLLLILLVKSQS